MALEAVVVLILPVLVVAVTVVPGDLFVVCDLGLPFVMVVAEMQFVAVNYVVGDLVVNL